MIRNFYVYYFRAGFRFDKAFRYATGVTVRTVLAEVLYYCVMLALFLLCLWFAIDAFFAETEIRANAAAGYTQGLEKVLANCFDGKGVQVGEKMYLCHLYDTGERI